MPTMRAAVSISTPTWYLIIATILIVITLSLTFSSGGPAGGGYVTNVLARSPVAGIILGVIIGITLWQGLPSYFSQHAVIVLGQPPIVAAHDIAIAGGVFFVLVGAYGGLRNSRRRRRKKR